MNTHLSSRLKPVVHQLFLRGRDKRRTIVESRLDLPGEGSGQHPGGDLLPQSAGAGQAEVADVGEREKGENVDQELLGQLLQARGGGESWTLARVTVNA